MGFVDKEEYLRARAEQTAMQRGIDLDKPFDLTRRVQAVRQMETQKFALAKAAKEGKLTAEAVGTWTPIGPAFVPNGQTDTTPNPVTGRTTALIFIPPIRTSLMLERRRVGFGAPSMVAGRGSRC